MIQSAMIQSIFNKISLSAILIVEVILLILIAINLLIKETGNAKTSIESYKFIAITKSAPQSIEDREFLRHKSWLSYD